MQEYMVYQLMLQECMALQLTNGTQLHNPLNTIDGSSMYGTPNAGTRVNNAYT